MHLCRREQISDTKIIWTHLIFKRKECNFVPETGVLINFLIFLMTLFNYMGLLEFGQPKPQTLPQLTTLLFTVGLSLNTLKTFLGTKTAWLIGFQAFISQIWSDLKAIYIFTRVIAKPITFVEGEYQDPLITIISQTNINGNYKGTL